jgi:hypothetical protein
MNFEQCLSNNYVKEFLAVYRGAKISKWGSDYIVATYLKITVFWRFNFIPELALSS